MRWTSRDRDRDRDRDREEIEIGFNLTSKTLLFRIRIEPF